MVVVVICNSDDLSIVVDIHRRFQHPACIDCAWIQQAIQVYHLGMVPEECVRITLFSCIAVTDCLTVIIYGKGMADITAECPHINNIAIIPNNRVTFETAGLRLRISDYLSKIVDIECMAKLAAWQCT